MPTVTLSPKYQVVIPKALREELGLKPGQRLVWVRENGALKLVPLRPVEEYEGFLVGISSDVPRDDDRV